ncbi:SDR family oxidoreductase [Geomicrobium sp. JCM 19055]|uniref:SDR family oxidoreductase n=1 Tax=Geomicrobium sp. JCM 19055 TaxID=1460649 RepID=UPI00045ED81F|nr:SDR family oxidoreductase [Geomicrobium sp. JCM 19055]GAJ98858.1 oxidoreductase [Geomicrobium sp. JCM 19055]
MENTYFITGYPGFLSGQLLDEIVATNNVHKLYLLVQPSMLQKAKQQFAIDGLFQNQWEFIPGDITEDELGLSQELRHNLQRSVTHVFHLAAIYDLSVKEKVAHKVNVVGTRNVNQFVEGIHSLKRYTYFSTAFVSGDREGTIFETELIRDQQFKNHYERSKYEAEVLALETKQNVPTTIIRPGIVRGHSKTGVTTKFDGVYFYLNMLERFRQLRFRNVPLLVKGSVNGNFVPVDYVVRAAVFLSHHEKGIGKTYHLTDPHPYTMEEVYTMLSETYLQKTPKKTLLSHIAGHSLNAVLERYFRVSSEALAYHEIDATYDSSQTVRDLSGSGIICPDFKETLAPMVSYYRDHRQDQLKYVT